MTIRLKNKYFARFLRHPSLVGALAACGLVVWVAWIGYTFFISPSPSEEDIAGQTVQLKVVELQQLTGTISSYRTPATLPPVRDSLFTSITP